MNSKCYDVILEFSNRWIGGVFASAEPFEVQPRYENLTKLQKPGIESPGYPVEVI